jgi:D-psicose/D-tagatose/L-ribulose 3-epimerase
MQISMHNWMRAEPVKTTIRRLARYGYDSIEISYDSVALSPGAPGTAAVRKMLKDSNLRCWGSISLMFEGRDLTHADEDVRKNSVDYLKGCITMVKELEGEVMSIVPSEVGKTQPMASPEEEWQWAIEGLKEVHDHAQREGVPIALEPLTRFETNFLNRHDQALMLAEQVAPDVGVCLDTYHMNQEEADVYAAIRNTGAKLYDLHVAENNRMAPGQGALDWEKIVSTARQAGYEGALTVEFVPPLDRTPANPYKNALASAERQLTPEQLKFIEDHGSGVLSEEFYSYLAVESIKMLRRYV